MLGILKPVPLLLTICSFSVKKGNSFASKTHKTDLDSNCSLYLFLSDDSTITDISTQTAEEIHQYKWRGGGVGMLIYETILYDRIVKFW